MDIAVNAAVRALAACVMASAMAGMSGVAAAQSQTPAPGQGQALADPTRPPAVMGVQAGQGGEGGAPAEPPAPQLQSILVSREPGGRRVAVINGETVRQGMKVGGAVVEKVGETEVVLRRGKTLETLKLFPKP